MSNPYCNISQLAVFMDARTSVQLTSDGSYNPEQSTVMQSTLDVNAGVMEAKLGGIYNIPILTPAGAAPPILTYLVGVLTASQVLGRRMSKMPWLFEARKEAMEIMKDIQGWKSIIPGVSRLDTPTLVCSDDLGGLSWWEGIPYFSDWISATSASGGVPGAYGMNMGVNN